MLVGTFLTEFQFVWGNFIAAVGPARRTQKIFTFEILTEKTRFHLSCFLCFVHVRGKEIPADAENILKLFW